jgi:hypothetical protein
MVGRCPSRLIRATSRKDGSEQGVGERPLVELSDQRLGASPFLRVG